MQSLPHKTMERLAAAASDTSRIAGVTHSFYRYPARFSPVFARVAIEAFTEPGDLVMDPYMGGGTTVVEALRSGRAIVGNDLNSLSTFITRVKTTLLTDDELRAARRWTSSIFDTLRYNSALKSRGDTNGGGRVRNMSLPRAKFIKKLMALGLCSLEEIPKPRVRNLIRCALLRTGQWALDGKKSQTTVREFREKLIENSTEMLEALEQLRRDIAGNNVRDDCRHLRHGDAASIAHDRRFASLRAKVDLVVTSPPYPGVHVLYHRWQVDGRRETPAPYWLAGCADGQGAAFYNFGDRHEESLNSYFESSLRTLRGVRAMMRPGGVVVQMIAFSDPKAQLPRYLDNMHRAGFLELMTPTTGGESQRIWRNVPSRKWHASLKGRTPSSREVVLIHRAG